MNDKSPEQETKDQIKHEYKETYPNIIFTLVNSVDSKAKEIERLKERLAIMDNYTEILEKELREKNHKAWLQWVELSSYKKVYDLKDEI